MRASHSPTAHIRPTPFLSLPTATEGPKRLLLPYIVFFESALKSTLLVYSWT